MSQPEEFSEFITNAVEGLIQRGASNWLIGLTAALKKDHSRIISQIINTGNQWTEENKHRLCAVFDLKFLLEKDKHAIKILEDAIDPSEQCKAIGEQLVDLGLADSLALELGDPKITLEDFELLYPTNAEVLTDTISASVREPDTKDC
ncbi:hypothetical protein NP233_g1953 [Leucocoprinus birnbaumii]|uniref:Uncharacterized protein n=1 Tax=Leucocoprinus birnbaumii TaxID=56174 RepID=A0AAD5YVB6_9AGAR|nr:hypothetical protein NP233_g1953 [Leucocoprinus birnbaumii]